jgi:acetylornithine deacetylase/succinyl-diaminopimelate desuccinylase-like protein
MIEEYRKIFVEKKDEIIGQWVELLKFPSISADSAYSPQCEQCCAWLAEYLKELGFAVEVIKGEGKPLIFAERLGDKSKKSILLYGHYDVQPVEPLELWKSKPFEPEIRDGRLYARGAQDDKGQLFYVLKAIETLISQNALTCPLKILIEGEEEHGSAHIAKAIPKLKDRIKSDILMVCDTGTLDASLAAITMGLRGIIACEVRLHGPNYDLHSGVHGGLIRNPATEIARLVASLHNADGSIAIKDYYRDIKPLSELERDLANQAPYQLDVYEKTVGISPNGGEKGYSVAERRGMRPTVEVNGIYGGYTGEGGKTIIPSHATVKISSRLVTGQDPAWCLKALLNHLKEHAPDGMRLEVISESVGGPAISLNADSEIVAIARSVLDQVCDNKTIFIWEGASIPIVAELALASKSEPLLVGFGLEEDCIHAPNESFSIAQFEKGFLYSALLLRKLSE